MEEEILKVPVPALEVEVVDYTEILISIDEKLSLLQNLQVSFYWIFAGLFFIAGLMLMSLFFIGKGDKG